tara:strand:- start:2440 stop:4428 length:1989 start_codon:yes stop_codon:yes gene_type:complete
MNYVNGQMQPAPLQGVADQMAQYGRYGDSMLVHMNPAEVQGIASLVPGGLTTNPMTGQPEAFLPFLAPVIGSMLGSAALTGAGAGVLGAAGLSSAAAGAIGSGLATTALTGDLKEGLVSGLTGFGIGKALGAGLDLAKGVPESIAAVDAAKEGVTEASKLAGQAGKDALKSGLSASDLSAIKADPSIIGPLETVTSPAARGVADASMALSDAQQALTGAKSAYGQSLRNVGFGGRLKSMVTNPGAVGKQLMGASSIVPIAVGEGQRAQMDAMRQQERIARQYERDQEEQGRRAEEILGSAVGLAGRDYGLDLSGGNNPYTAYDPNYANGGIVSVNPDYYQRALQEAAIIGTEPMFRGGVTKTVTQQAVEKAQSNMPFSDTMSNIRFGPGSAASRQAQLRGPEVITPEELKGYRPGIDPEIMYFRQRTTDTTPDVPDVPGTMPPFELPDDFLDFVPFDVSEFAGIAGLRGRMASEEMPMGDIQEMAMQVTEQKIPRKGRKRDTDYTDIYDFEGGMQEGGEVRSADALIDQTIMAVLGRLSQDESDTVISRFVDEYGAEAFQQLRQEALAAVSKSDPQTEGEIVGEGGGMDDMIGGTIAGQQPVALSPGEYVVPADVVSSIGDGSTDAGVEQLDGMLDRVRMEKTGTTKQPDAISAKMGGMLPA